MIISLIYIDHIIELNSLSINSLNIHRILLSTIRLATKYHDEESYDNKYFAQVSGVKLEELNKLEIETLFLLSCTLYIEEEEYDCYLKTLQKDAKKKKNSSFTSIFSTAITTQKSFISDIRVDVEDYDE